MNITEDQQEALKRERIERTIKEIDGFFEVIELAAIGQNVCPGVDGFVAAARAGTYSTDNLRRELGFLSEDE